MVFEPDILVTSADGSEVMLVAETKWREKDVSKAEEQLKAYMSAMRSPIGLLVTPLRLRIYRDRYLPTPEKSIEQIGEYDVSELFRSYSKQAGQEAATRFENEVQNWLESLATKALGRELSPTLRRAAELNIVPAISQGVIRAGHPRSELSA